MRQNLIWLLLLCAFVVYEISYMMFYAYLDSKNLHEYENKPNHRIAICISGQVRDFEQTYPLLKKNMIDVLKPDIFCYMDGNESDETKDRFVSLYKPVRIVWCTKQFEHTMITPNSDKMFYRIYKCNDLKKQYEQQRGNKYDAVMRLRPDMVFHYTFPYHIIETVVNTHNTVYIPQWYLFNIVNPAHALYDIMAIGDSTSMDVYSDTHNHLQEHSKHECTAPEFILKQYMDNTRVDVRYFIYDHMIKKTILQKIKFPYEKIIKNKYYLCVSVFS